MIAKELLDILVCPETKQPLRLLDDAEVAKVNQSIRSQGLENRGGEKITEEVAGILLREDSLYAYLIRDGIPVMLVEESVKMSDIDA